MKHFTIILLLILGLCSCSRKSQNIDGEWILSHYILSNGEIELVDINSSVLLKTDGNKLKVRKFRTEKDGEIPMDTTLTFKLESNHIKIENFQEFGADMVFTEDSIVGTFQDHQVEKVIFKKLPPARQKISWTPNGKYYQFNGNQGLARADFINDSTMFEYGSENVSKVHWWFEQFEDHTFLILQNPVHTIPVLIDSVSDKSVYLKSIEDKVREYVYQEQSPANVPELLGKWMLTDKVYKDGVKESPYPFSRNNIEYLTIFNDSIVIISNGQTSKCDWTLSGSGKMMFIADKKYRIFEILELGQKELALEIGKEYFENRKRSIYQRE